LRIPRQEGGFAYRVVDGDSRTNKRSANGTYVNGQQVTSYELMNNDYILFARGVAAKFLYLMPEAAERVIASPASIMQDIDPAFRSDPQSSIQSTSAPTLDYEIPKSRRFEVSPTIVLNSKKSLQQEPGNQKPIASNVTNSQKVGKKVQYGRLGQFFLRTAALDEEELQKLLLEQSNSEKRIGELLVERGVISQSDLDKALENQQIHLGEILLKRHYITQEQLAEALMKQMSTREPLGHILLREGWVTAPEIEQALKEQQWRRNGFWFLD
ncbi:MAG: FHA domain-containing protein, partial [Prochlorotrichaceae cyanobacterium]